MTADQASVWTSVYLSVCGIALHAFFLWRGAAAEELRSRLLLLEMELLSSTGDPPPTAMRLARLVRNSRAHAADLTYCRFLAASVLLRGEKDSAGDLPRDIEALADPAWRERCRYVFAEWVAAVASRMTFGSPILWLRNLTAWSRKGGAARPLDLHLLEATFAPAFEK